jgi:hypothetical protein
LRAESKEARKAKDALEKQNEMITQEMIGMKKAVDEGARQMKALKITYEDEIKKERETSKKEQLRLEEEIRTAGEGEKKALETKLEMYKSHAKEKEIRLEEEKKNAIKEKEVLIKSYEEALKERDKTIRINNEKIKKAVEVSKGGNVEKVKALMGKNMMASKDWKDVYGVEVEGGEPSLPENMEAILNSVCGIHKDRKVKDTHRLVLMPEYVIKNGEKIKVTFESYCNPRDGLICYAHGAPSLHR